MPRQRKGETNEAHRLRRQADNAARYRRKKERERLEREQEMRNSQINSSPVPQRNAVRNNNSAASAPGTVARHPGMLVTGSASTLIPTFFRAPEGTPVGMMTPMQVDTYYNDTLLEQNESLKKDDENSKEIFRKKEKVADEKLKAANEKLKAADEKLKAADEKLKAADEYAASLKKTSELRNKNTAILLQSIEARKQNRNMTQNREIQRSQMAGGEALDSDDSFVFTTSEGTFTFRDLRTSTSPVVEVAESSSLSDEDDYDRKPAAKPTVAKATAPVETIELLSSDEEASTKQASAKEATVEKENIPSEETIAQTNERVSKIKLEDSMNKETSKPRTRSRRSARN